MRRTLGPQLALPVMVVLVILVGLPRPASAVTVDEVVALTKAGVSEQIILALIDRDRTVFTIAPDQLVQLQRDGVSETVILAMLKSGRAESDAQARADSARNAAAIPSSASTVPQVVILGHDPDWPNVSRSFYSTPPPVDILPAPYGLPYFIPYASRAPRQKPRRPAGSSTSPIQTAPTLCIEHPSTGPVPPMVGSMGFVTVCPPASR